jgi:hypothetical protein
MLNTVKQMRARPPTVPPTIGAVEFDFELIVVPVAVGAPAEEEPLAPRRVEVLLPLDPVVVEASTSTGTARRVSVTAAFPQAIYS